MNMKNENTDLLHREAENLTVLFSFVSLQKYIFAGEDPPSTALPGTRRPAPRSGSPGRAVAAGQRRVTSPKFSLTLSKDGYLS